MSEVPRRLERNSVGNAELYDFSAQVTGTGLETSTAHGFGTTPGRVWWSVVNGANGSGAAGTQCPTVTEGTHTSSNLLFTVTAGAVIKVFALK